MFLNHKHHTKMAIKALFFDIDGTLVSFKTHRIPSSTVDSLRRAKANGVKTYISTGRPVGFITNLGQIAGLIDGYITTNGALCFIGHNTVCRHEIAHSDVDTILQACAHSRRPAIVVGERDIAVYQHQPIVDKVFRDGLGLHDFRFADLDIVMRQPILQVTPFITAEKEAELMPTISDCTSGRWSPEFTDITQREADKGKGLLAMTAHLGLHADETMAFGDGGNDISIIRRAGIGVAMGNGGERVKAEADFVTTSVDDEGVRHALCHYGVI